VLPELEFAEGILQKEFAEGSRGLFSRKGENLSARGIP
jgi:hypothetical protein